MRQLVQQRAHDGALASPAGAVAVGGAANRNRGRGLAGAERAATVGTAQPQTRLQAEFAWQRLAEQDWLEALAQLVEQGYLRCR